MPPPPSPWQPYREPLRATLLRTGMIAIIGGSVLATFWRGGGFIRWPVAVLMMLWPSFGGHWVEIWFLNWLRPRIPVQRGMQIAARLATWLAGGVILGLGMGLTANLLLGFPWARWPAWWVLGLGFAGVEMVAHLALVSSGRPNFFNGRG